MRDSVSFKEGDLFGRYRIKHLIGSGGFADVYRAVRLADGADVAIKCMQHRHSANERARERMSAEAALLGRLRHVNVVRVSDAGIHDGVLFMVMEYLAGRSLREVMVESRGHLPILKALYYAREIADGIVAAHEMRVIHRDLKPENVMVSAGDEVKVLDLGAGKFFGWGVQSTAQGPVIGTPLYMSPEHITGVPVDGRTDIYSLGIMLYEMLAGRHPFAHESGEMPSRFEIPTLHLHAAPRSLAALIPGFPPYIAAVVERAIAKDRALRYDTMRDFAQTVRGVFQRYLEEQGEGTSASDGPEAALAADTAAATTDAKIGSTIRDAITVSVPRADAQAPHVAAPGSSGTPSDGDDAATIKLPRSPSAIPNVVQRGRTEPMPKRASKPAGSTLELDSTPRTPLMPTAPFAMRLAQEPVTEPLPGDPPPPPAGPYSKSASPSDAAITRPRHPFVLPLAMFLGCLLGTVGVGVLAIYFLAPQRGYAVAPLDVPLPTKVPDPEGAEAPTKGQAEDRPGADRAASALPTQGPQTSADTSTAAPTARATAAPTAKAPAGSPSPRASVAATPSPSPPSLPSPSSKAKQPQVPAASPKTAGRRIF